ncbi:tripartite tricarboxylate transporter substrate binding protein [Pigmentiphaga sp.]|uniref:Bug family tripartite tricarboxylate transporter substrate binding protein n=1 Tax=Pigmentiphaga sp. TaxID=1977564 RepID=UPI00128C3ECF|nr:tripartite tricarboxylate transporter substrate binding protein [Pigmentiphaga sp.]MPS25975.1 tripartite tricarboxylate transporter substrate binding protein [Alcaligenaceae bacterium SAGV5]MPS52917.1 tripartite tricarboxylate transporter substrate binding protein [Alcaligenaceae bacterium SAGV3]MPT59876.1 tripartite tricarboxylate transporter substrate binding protein [Alcaligenaceae bacterium]
MLAHPVGRALMALGLLNLLPAAQAADPYPTRAIRLIVPFEPGGSTDLTARIVAQALGEKLGQSVVVENKGGAGGNIGTAFVAEAKGDGYTLVWANVAPVAINPHLYSKMSYDPARDLAPIGLATVFPNVLVVKASFPVSTLQDFVAKAGTSLQTLSYGSAGNGSSTHLAAEWLNTRLGTKWLHVPYKGGGPALMAVVGGQVDMYFSSVPAAIPYLKNGTLKAIGVTSKGRTDTLPGVPPIASANLPDYEALNWNGLMAPAATPAAILDKLNAELRAVLESPDVRQRMLAQGADPSPMTREEFAAYIRSESLKWEKIVKTANARIQ